MIDTPNHADRNPEQARDSGPADATDRDQPSALGGRVATRSSTATGDDGEPAERD